MDWPVLNLPAILSRTEEREGEEFIWDPIRKKLLLLTPEEWVRQHFVSLLTNQLGYPAGLVQLERQHKYHVSAKRTDIIILDKNGNPFLLVECKAPNVKIGDQVLGQIALYNKSLQANFIAVSNGMKHFVWEWRDENYVQLKDFPAYTG